jgi:hypothetical protein
MPEQLLDDADLERVSELPIGSPFRQVARPVGLLRFRVRLPNGAQVEANCTATLVTVDLLLTAQHCIPGRYGLQALSATVEMVSLMPVDAPIVERFTVEAAPLEASADMDFSLLRVRGRPGDRFGWARLAGRPAAQGEAAFIVHFPHGTDPMISRHGCQVHRASVTDFLHSCDTSWGSSGAPVFSAVTGLLIGLHYAGSREANYGKQATAILARSAILTSLGGNTNRRQAVSGGFGPPGNMLAGQGETAVAQQVREALTLVGISAPGEPSSAPPQAPRPEPFFIPDPEGDTPETSR